MRKPDIAKQLARRSRVSQGEAADRLSRRLHDPPDRVEFVDQIGDPALMVKTLRREIDEITELAATIAGSPAEVGS